MDNIHFSWNGMRKNKSHEHIYQHEIYAVKIYGGKINNFTMKKEKINIFLLEMDQSGRILVRRQTL